MSAPAVLELPDHCGFVLGEELGAWHGFSERLVLGDRAVGGCRALVRVGPVQAISRRIDDVVRELQRLQACEGLPVPDVLWASEVRDEALCQLCVVERIDPATVPIEEFDGGPAQWSWDQWRVIVHALLSGVRDLHAAGFACGPLDPSDVRLGQTAGSRPRVVFRRVIWAVARSIIDQGIEVGAGRGREQVTDLERLKALVIEWAKSFVGGGQAQSMPDIALDLIEFMPPSGLLDLVDELLTKSDFGGPLVDAPVATGSASAAREVEQATSTYVPEVPGEEASRRGTLPGVGLPVVSDPPRPPAGAIGATPEARQASPVPASSYEEIDQFRSAVFFEDEIRGRVLALRTSLAPHVEAAEQALREAGGNSVATVRALIGFLSELENSVGNGGHASDVADLCRLLTQHLQTCGAKALPEHGLDLDLKEVYQRQLYGVDCKFEFSDASPPVRPGSLIQLERSGFDLFGEVIRRGSVIISLGPPPSGLNEVESFSLYYPTHGLSPHLRRLKDTVMAEYPQLLDPEARGVEAFEQELLRIAERVPRQGGDEEYAGLRTGLHALVSWSGYSVYPPFNGQRYQSAWDLDADGLEAAFHAEAPPGTVLYAAQTGLRRREREIQRGRLGISVGAEPAGCEQLMSRLERLRAEVVTPLRGAVEDIRQRLASRRLRELGVDLPEADIDADLAKKICHAATLVFPSASSDAWGEIVGGLSALLLELDRRRRFDLIPSLHDREARFDAHSADTVEVVRERVDSEQESYEEFEAVEFGYWFDGAVCRKGRFERVAGRRALVHDWIAKAGETLAGLGAGQEVEVARSDDAARAWGVSRVEERFEARDALLNRLQGLVARLETVGAEGGDASRRVSSVLADWEQWVEPGLGVALLPRPGVELDARTRKLLVEGTEEPVRRYHQHAPLGELIEVQAIGLYETKRGIWIRAPRIAISLGLADGVEDLLGDLRTCLGSEEVLPDLAAGLPALDRGGVLDLTRRVFAVAGERVLDPLAYAARSRVITRLGEALDRHGLRIENASTSELSAPGRGVHGFEIEAVLVDNPRRPFDVLRPRLIDSASGEEFCGGLVRIQLPTPELLEALRETSLAELPRVVSWMRTAQEQIVRRRAIPEDSELLVGLLEAIGAPLSPSDAEQLVPVLASVSARWVGLDGALEPGLDSMDLHEVVSRAADDSPVGTVLSIERPGIVSEIGRMLVPARLVVSRGPGGPILEQVDALEVAVRAAVQRGVLWADDLAECESEVERIRASVREGGARFARDEGLLSQVRVLLNRFACAAGDGELVAALREIVEANSAIRGDGEFAILEDPAANPDAFTVRRVLVGSAVGWVQWVYRPAKNSQGDIRRGEVWSAETGDDPLATLFANLIVQLREDSGVGGLCSEIVRDAARIDGADDLQRDRVAAEAVQKIARAALEQSSSLTGPRVRTLTRPIKQEYLGGRGWYEIQIRVGDPVDRYAPSLARVSEGGCADGLVSAVVLPGFASRDGSRVLVHAAVR